MDGEKKFMRSDADEDGHSDRSHYARKYDHHGDDHSSHFSSHRYSNPHQSSSSGGFGGMERRRFEPYGFKGPNTYERKESSEEELFKTAMKSGLDFDKYDDIPIDLRGKDAPKPIEKFSEFNFAKPLMDNITRAGYEKPTPVQKYSIPIGIAKRDLMSCAQTGSGKTAAFLFPIIHNLQAQGDHIPGLFLFF